MEGETSADYDDFNVAKPPVRGDDGLTSLGETPTSIHTASGFSRRMRKKQSQSRDPILQLVADTLGGKGENLSKANEKLAKIAAWYQEEFEEAARQKRVLVLKMPGLISLEQIRIRYILISNP